MAKWNAERVRRAQVTRHQAWRLGYIAAYGPVQKKPGDDDLIRKGWIEHYDDDDDEAVWTTDQFIEHFYGDNGAVRPAWVREEDGT